MAIISNAKFSEAFEADRFDAEFFDPADLALIAQIQKAGGQLIGAVCDVLNGATPTEYIENGEIPIVRSGDLVAPLIYPDCGSDFLRAAKTPNMVFLEDGDVLISSIGMGSIGKISLVMDADKFATVSEVTVLRSKGYPPEVLFTYLTTMAGQRQINRQITGATGQQHLLKSKVEAILVPPEPTKSVCDAIRKSCKNAWALEKRTAAQHAKTHSIFADALGL